MKKNHNEITASELPFHIIHEIILNLPLKSLIRFKAISTQWCELISSKSFARAQLHQKKVSSVIVHMGSLSELEPRILYIDENTLGEAEFCGELEPITASLPPCTSSDDVRVEFINCCDGILCAHYSCDKRFLYLLLWNPITNWYMKIPPPDHYNSTEEIYLIGFGYNPSDDDYKLVTIVDEMYLEILSLKSNTWRRICSKICDIFPDFRHNSFMDFHKPAMCLNGVLYWLGGPGCIMSLDLANETLSKVNRPNSSRQFKIIKHFSRLTILQGMLCMIWAYWVSEEEKCFIAGHDVWVMKEANNWIKVFDIPMPSGRGKGRPMCCTHEAAIVMNTDGLSIHGGSGTTERIYVRGADHYWSRSIGYAGSLVTPEVLVKPRVNQTYSRRKQEKKLRIE